MSDYPKLPEGYVYLGKGGQFQCNCYLFRGASCEEGDTSWSVGGWSGDAAHRHYCAHKDSEIAKLNAKTESTVERHPGFIVWSAQRGEPTKIHATRAEADTEAQRLAAKHPSHIFCVCEITARYQATVSVNKL